MSSGSTIPQGETGVSFDGDDLLRRVADLSCVTTGATGAAVALRRESDGAVVCRAASGQMAPPPGTPLNTQSGISGECLRTGRVLRCQDTESDLRVDPAACRQLGVRSLVAVPVDNGHSIVGILEVFSSLPDSFTDQHAESLQKLARLVGASIAPSVARPVAPPPAVAPWPGVTPQKPAAATSPAPQERHHVVERVSLPEQAMPWDVETGRSSRLHWTIPASVVSVVLASLLSLAVFVRMRGRTPNPEPVTVAQSAAPAPETPAVPRPTAGLVFHGGSSRLSATNHQAKLGPVQNASEVNKIANAEEDPEVRTINVGPTRETPTAQPTDDVPPPSDALSAGTQTASEISTVLAAPSSMPHMAMTVSQGVTGGKLKHRVDPVYPGEARQMRAEGPVVLRANVSEDGTVHDVSIVKGNPLLARAAIDAVRKWRFEPFQLNHKPVAIQTDITVNFKLQ